MWQWPWKGLISYSSQEKLTNLHYTCLTRYIRDTLYTDWLALINCTSSSPALWAQVQENLFLLSSNSPPTSVSSIYHEVHSPLLRDKDAYIHSAYCWVPHSFLEKYPSDNSGKVSLKTLWYNFFSASVLQLSALLFPRKLVASSLDSLIAVLSLPLRMRSYCLPLYSMHICESTGIPSLIFVALIPGNFSAMYLNAVAIWYVSPAKFFIIPCWIRRGGSKMLLDSTSSRCCTFFVPISIDCQEGQSLFLKWGVFAPLSNSHNKH